MVKYNDSMIFVLGGNHDQTWIVNPLNDFSFTLGPSMWDERGDFACGTIIKDGKVHIIAAGGQFRDSVEFLDPSSQRSRWVKGPKLPGALQGPSMVPSPSGNGVVIIGGKQDSYFNEVGTLLELQISEDSSMTWVEMRASLKFPRSGHLSMLIPEDLTSCHKRSMNRILVVSGLLYEQGQVAEVIDMSDSNLVCEALPSVPKVTGAVGGLLDGKYPTLCSGYAGWYKVSGCQVIGRPDVNLELLQDRVGAAGVVLNNTILWIVGGSKYIGTHNTTEFIRSNGITEQGPTLPFFIKNHCMVKYNESMVFILGGSDERGLRQRTTWIVDLSNNGFDVYKGPSMLEKKEEVACGLMQVRGKTNVIVAGGRTTKAIDTTEFWDPESNEGWQVGPKLPQTRSSPVILPSPDVQDVLLLGGVFSADPNDQKILKLDGESWQWKTMDQKLSGSRSDFVAMYLPDELTSCKTL